MMNYTALAGAAKKKHLLSANNSNKEVTNTRSVNEYLESESAKQISKDNPFYCDTM